MEKHQSLRINLYAVPFRRSRLHIARIPAEDRYIGCCIRGVLNPNMAEETPAKDQGLMPACRFAARTYSSHGYQVSSATESS